MTHGARLLQWALWLCLLLSAAAAAVQCDEIWTQAIRSNSPVPAMINYPAPNPSFPEPLQAGDYYYDNNANWQIPANTIRTTVAPTARLFINGNLTIGANSRLNDRGVAEHFILVVSGSVTIQSGARINGFILAGGAITLNDNVQIQGGITAKGALANFGATVQFDANALTRLQGGGLCSATLGCQTDNFSDGLLSEDWVTSRSSGTFTPSVVNGRLRLTQAVGNQSTSVTFQRLFPAADNLVIIEFDYFGWSPASGQGADGIAVILSDASVTPQPGAFGGSLGYAQKGPGTDCPNCPGFAGGWLGIGLDEWGNFSNPTEGRVGGPGFRRNAISIRGAQANQYRYLAGTAAGLSPPIDQRPSATAAPGHRYRIVIDSRLSGQALVSVARDVKAGAGFQNLVEPFNALAQPGQGAVPENFFLSFTGSTGGSNNNHELDNVSICALRSLPVGVQIDHIALTHQLDAISCLASAVQVKACLNADCSTLYTDPVSVDLFTTGGSWSANPVLLTNGTGSAYLRHPAGGTTTIGVVETVPPRKSFSQTVCKVGSEDSDCQINFVDTGLMFAEQDGVTPFNHQTAAVEFNGVLRAVRTNTTTGACEARVTGSQTVQLGFSCENPATCSGGQNLNVNSEVVAANAAGQTVERTAVNLLFDANGSAPLTMNYPDVGQLILHASLELSEQTPDPVTTLHGSSNAFVVKPHTLQVAGVERLDGSANPATTDSGSGFVAAGEAFRVRLDARNALGQLTPNFGREIVPERLTVALQELVYPDPGQDDSSLLQAGDFQPDPMIAGRLASDQIRWHEAGSIRLFARLTDNDYLSAGDVVAKPQSDVIGRFYPKNLRLLEHSSVLNTCRLDADPEKHFSYMGENKLIINFQLVAEGEGGTTLENYHSDTYTGTAAVLVIAEHDTERLDAGRLSVNAGQWLHGIYRIEQSDASFRRAVPSERDGPYEVLQLGLQIVTEQDSRDFAAYTLGSDAVALNGLLRMRYGRLMLENAFGPEDEPLPLAFRAEYWDGERFVHNAADHCTQVTKTEDSLTTVEGPSTLSLDGVGGLLENGRFPAQTLYLNPPGLVNYWIIEYRVDPWLRDGGVNLDQNPQAEVFFGRYRGNPRRIYWREPLP